MELPKYSFGIGDRFGRQGKALLQAMVAAGEQGIDIAPVWNKSHREHTIIGTDPADTRSGADEAVSAQGWRQPYFVDADHINFKNVDDFIACSDFFTVDVADYISQQSDDAARRAFVERRQKFVGQLAIPGIEGAFDVTPELIDQVAEKYLFAMQEAGRIYRHVEQAKGRDNFVTEVSIDETGEPQSPIELLFILAALADEGVPLQTIAPKFTGRFNKGVDYDGDVQRFTTEFEQDLAVINFAITEFALPANLKLSVHSGSDKFSIYASIRQTLQKFDAGVHVKTAGTTWLEELIGLALAGGEGLSLAKEVYRQAHAHFDQLAPPYAAVIDIDKTRLPSPAQVNDWDGQTFAAALRHDPAEDRYNPHFRQLLHIGYKIAAQMGNRYLDALDKYQTSVAQNVTQNIYQRHIRPIFLP